MNNGFTPEGVLHYRSPFAKALLPARLRKRIPRDGALDADRAQQQVFNHQE